MWPIIATCAHFVCYTGLVLVLLVSPAAFSVPAFCFVVPLASGLVANSIAAYISLRSKIADRQAASSTKQAADFQPAAVARWAPHTAAGAAAVILCILHPRAFLCMVPCAKAAIFQTAAGSNSSISSQYLHPARYAVLLRWTFLSCLMFDAPPLLVCLALLGVFKLGALAPAVLVCTLTGLTSLIATLSWVVAASARSSGALAKLFQTPDLADPEYEAGQVSPRIVGEGAGLRSMRPTVAATAPAPAVSRVPAAAVPTDSRQLVAWLQGLVDSKAIAIDDVRSLVDAHDAAAPMRLWASASPAAAPTVEPSRAETNPLRLLGVAGAASPNSDFAF